MRRTLGAQSTARPGLHPVPPPTLRHRAEPAQAADRRERAARQALVDSLGA